jgi:hypothetical protein
MVQAIAILGFGLLFLLIAPGLRSMAMDGIAAGFGNLAKYSPWSYAACAFVGLILVWFTLNRGSRPR